MRRPVRTLRSVRSSGWTPCRRDGVRPADVSRVPRGKRYAEWDLVSEWLKGFDKGRKITRDQRERRLAETAVRAVIGEFGFDIEIDLMTRGELRELALLFARMAGKVTERYLAVPIEPYLIAEMSPRDREFYERNQRDDDIDLPLDDEDES